MAERLEVVAPNRAVKRKGETRERKRRKPINRFSEAQLLHIASDITSVSPGNILLLGGGAVLSEIAGYQRLRGRSDDLDFIANEAGLEALLQQYNIKPWPVENVGYFTVVDDVLVGVFYPTIRGLVMEQSIYDASVIRTTSQGQIHTVPAELNLALKIRRGASKNPPAIYGKDGIDAATLVTGLRVLNSPFDPPSFRATMELVCQSCRLEEPLACLDAIERHGSKQLPQKERPYFEEVIGSCRRELAQQCKYSEG